MKNQNTIKKVMMLENFEIENLERDAQKKLFDKSNKNNVKEINSMIITKIRKLSKSNKNVTIFTNKPNKFWDDSSIKSESPKNISELIDTKNIRNIKTTSSFKNESHKGGIISNIRFQMVCNYLIISY